MRARDVKLPTTLLRQRQMRDRKVKDLRMQSEAACPLSRERHDRVHTRNCGQGGECHEPWWNLGWDYCHVFLKYEADQKKGGEKR